MTQFFRKYSIDLNQNIDAASLFEFMVTMLNQEFNKPGGIKSYIESELTEENKCPNDHYISVTKQKHVLQVDLEQE